MTQTDTRVRREERPHLEFFTVPLAFLQEMIASLEERGEELVDSLQKTIALHEKTIGDLQKANKDLQADNARLLKQAAYWKGRAELDPISALVAWVIRQARVFFNQGYSYFWGQRKVSREQSS